MKNGFASVLRTLLAVGTVIICCRLTIAADPGSAAVSGAPADAIKHWQEMRFGMFIHWGPVSV